MKDGTLNPRERTLVGLFLVVAVLVGYVGFSLKGRLDELDTLEARTVGAREQIESIKASAVETPDADALTREVEGLRARKADLEQRLTAAGFALEPGSRAHDLDHFDGLVSGIAGDCGVVILENVPVTVRDRRFRDPEEAASIPVDRRRAAGFPVPEFLGERPMRCLRVAATFAGFRAFVEHLSREAPSLLFAGFSMERRGLQSPRRSRVRAHRRDDLGPVVRR